MSFKREGDDQSQLNLLKKRRVSDLLADDVPEDEAFLMSNGRYACTVCHHRPVLDTIAMLLVHRQGKKHQSYVKSYYAKKQHLMKEVEKRKQQLYLMNQEQKNSSLEEVEDVAPLLTKTRKATHHALLKAAPYKGYGGPSRKQESSSHSFQGKTAGSFFQRVSQNSFREDSSLGPATSATHVGNLPGHRIHSSISQSEMTADGPSPNKAKGRDKTSEAIGHTDDASDGDSLSKLCDQNGPSYPLTVTEKRCPMLFQLKPYIPKNQRNKGIVHKAHVDSESVTTSTTQNDNESNTEMPLTAVHETTSARTPQSLQSNASGKETISGASGSGSIKCDPGTKRTHPTPSKDLKSSQKISKSATRSKNSSGVSEDTSRSHREKYLKLTSSGWKTDWKGGWVQDQDVEFDSDEDVPK